MEIQTVKVVHRTKFLNLNCSHYLDNNGKDKLWDWVERPHNTRAVMIGAMLGNKLVMIKEFRVPLNNYIWGLPAGLVESNESSLEAASREIIEETGLKIISYIRGISPTTRTSPGLTDERLDFVFANVEGTPSNILQEASEDIEVHLLSRIDAATIIQNQEQIDSKAYLIMLRFIEDGKI